MQTTDVNKLSKRRASYLYGIPGVLLYLLCACQTNAVFTPDDIAGAWKVDSVFQYTNGFVERKGIPDLDEAITYEYTSTGELTMKKGNEERNFQYEILDGDSLVYRTMTGTFMVGYRILALKPGKLALRKRQRPAFSGKNQEIYEIRQFLPATTTR